MRDWAGRFGGSYIAPQPLGARACKNKPTEPHEARYRDFDFAGGFLRSRRSLCAPGPSPSRPRGSQPTASIHEMWVSTGGEHSLRVFLNGGVSVRIDRPTIRADASAESCMQARMQTRKSAGWLQQCPACLLCGQKSPVDGTMAVAAHALPYIHACQLHACPCPCMHQWHGTDVCITHQKHGHNATIATHRACCNFGVHCTHVQPCTHVYSNSTP